MEDEKTKLIDLEECVNKEYSQIIFEECKECDGYNYNCTSYYKLKDYVGKK